MVCDRCKKDGIVVGKQVGNAVFYLCPECSDDYVKQLKPFIQQFIRNYESMNNKVN